jgi:hypothetical protein
MFGCSDKSVHVFPKCVALKHPQYFGTGAIGSVPQVGAKYILSLMKVLSPLIRQDPLTIQGLTSEQNARLWIMKQSITIYVFQTKTNQ